MTAVPRAADALLELADVRVFVNAFGDRQLLVRGVDLKVGPGEIVCLVGESGSGKTLTAGSALALPQMSGLQVEGRVLVDGIDAVDCSAAELRAIRGGVVGMIAQEPALAFNPTMRVGDQIVQAGLFHVRRGRRSARARLRDRAIEILASLGVPDPERCMRQYPHQFSGGMLQRASLAMALINDPALLIADEPTTALDVTVQAQTLALLKQLTVQRRMATLLITHDLGVTAAIADRVAVMYAGEIVEHGPVDEVLSDPRHPYTAGLLQALPSNHADGSSRLATIPGLVPAPSERLDGCRFAPRCPRAVDLCTTRHPPLLEIGTARRSACWFSQDAATAVNEGHEEAVQ